MRDITNDVETEIEKTEVQPFFLFEGEFATGFVRAWSGYGDLTWDGKTWSGTGTLLSFTEVEEASDTSARGVTVTLNGIPSELISLALGEVRQGKTGKIYLGFFDNGIVDDPVLMFEGRLDVPVIEEEAEFCSIQISYESRLIDLQRPRIARYTKQDQSRFFPADRGFDFVESIQEKELVWGRR